MVLHFPSSFLLDLGRGKEKKVGSKWNIMATTKCPSPYPSNQTNEGKGIFSPHLPLPFFSKQTKLYRES